MFCLHFIVFFSCSGMPGSLAACSDVPARGSGAGHDGRDAGDGEGGHDWDGGIDAGVERACGNNKIVE